MLYKKKWTYEILVGDQMCFCN